MRTAILLLFALAVVSCDPNKKLTRLLTKHPELRDTVTIYDTVWAVVEYVKADSVFVPVEGDTVYIERDRLRVKYVDVPGPTVYIEGECLEDTVYVPVRYDVPVIQPTEKVEVIPWWVYALGGACLLIAVLALLRR